MLNTIKNIINEKREFMEAADIIMEDGLNRNLDDYIVLGEEADAEAAEDIEEGEDGEGPDFDEETIKTEDTDDDDDEDESDEDDDSEDDFGNQTISTDDTDDGAGISDPTEPATPNIPDEDPIDDIMSISIDLRSNTPNDILPVPPDNAGDAIVSDEMGGQHVDSGFGESLSISLDGDDEEITESTYEPDGIFDEAISIGDDDSSSEKDNKDEGEEEDVPASNGDDGSGGKKEENSVTSAVRDKVSESQPDNTPDAGFDEPTDSASTSAGGGASKEAIMNKLSSLTKNLEDAKNLVMKSLQ